MSRFCSCPEPDVRNHESGEKYCAKCNDWYDFDIWQNDPRVKEARNLIHDRKIIRRHVRPAPDVYKPCACGSSRAIKFCCGWAKQLDIVMKIMKANQEQTHASPASTASEAPETPLESSTSNQSADHPGTTSQ